MSNLGLGFYHSAVELCGVEFAYGGHKYDETGVYTIKPRSLRGAQFLKQEDLGETYLSR